MIKRFTQTFSSKVQEFKKDVRAQNAEAVFLHFLDAFYYFAASLFVVFGMFSTYFFITREVMGAI